MAIYYDNANMKYVYDTHLMVLYHCTNWIENNATVLSIKNK